ncbi:MAG: membrane protein insertase YidC, partial [Pseudomonadota bacterium]
MSDQRNLILAFAISMGILLIWNMYVSPPPPPAEPAVSSEVPNAPANANTPTPSPQPGKGADAVVAREQAIENTPRLPINSPSLKGSIALKGGRIDDLIFTKYFTTVEQETPEILLSPAKTVGGYYANLGWVAASGQAVAVPGADTIWTPDGDELTPNRPVTLTWDNGAGLTFERRIEVDDDYMFTITQRVRATGSVAATLIPYGLVARLDTPKTAGIFVLHEGPLGVFDSTLKTLSYSDMREDGPVTRESTGGWIGITDKYWMTALIPDQSAQVMGRFVHTNTGRDRYQTDFIYKSAIAVSPGQDAVVTTRLFAGAKEVDLINNYRKAFDIDRFDLTIDWGWFVFLTKPFFWALHQIHGFVGNFGIAILGLTVLIKLVFFPLANTSYKSLAKMKAMQPRMKEIRERYFSRYMFDPKVSNLTGGRKQFVVSEYKLRC